ncbi:MAG: sulfite exporter TauE/SafE family protein [Alphaproteobacteria bacterium]|nr:MAG: sulfite exporter TauE/SafE family protein [Alphaproteobacteria bacterium]
MTSILGLQPPELALAMLAGAGAGFVKGAVGFGMPMLMISSLASFLPPETALGALILPTLVTNAAQALRQGPASALATACRFRLYLSVLVGMIFVTALWVPSLPRSFMFALVGTLILVFVASQLVGLSLRRPPGPVPLAVSLGLAGGFSGGLAGVWGPPTVAYLLALNVPKVEMIRAQGVIYSVGSVVLLAGHLRSGVFSGQAAWLSAVLVVPVLAAMYLGVRAQDRLDARRFRQATLLVLALAGANLLRRAFLV